MTIPVAPADFQGDLVALDGTRLLRIESWWETAVRDRPVGPVLPTHVVTPLAEPVATRQWVWTADGFFLRQVSI